MKTGFRPRFPTAALIFFLRYPARREVPDRADRRGLGGLGGWSDPQPLVALLTGFNDPSRPSWVFCRQSSLASRSCAKWSGGRGSSPAQSSTSSRGWWRKSRRFGAAPSRSSQRQFRLRSVTDSVGITDHPLLRQQPPWREHLRNIPRARDASRVEDHARGRRAYACDG